MAFHQSFTSPRNTPADLATLQAILRASLDPTVGVSASDISHYDVDKDSPWSPSDIATCQTAIDTCATQTAQSLVKAFLDNQPIVDRARDLANIDQLNVIRRKLVPPLPDITPQQALNAVKAKVDTLT